MVIDLVDSCGNFNRQAAVRAKFYREEGYEIQNLKIPLGLHPIELKSFLPEIETYLHDTTFKQSKLDKSKAEIDDEEDDRQSIKKIGHCVFDDEQSSISSSTLLEKEITYDSHDFQDHSGLSLSSQKPKTKVRLILKKLD